LRFGGSTLLHGMSSARARGSKSTTVGNHPVSLALRLSGPMQGATCRISNPPRALLWLGLNPNTPSQRAVGACCPPRPCQLQHAPSEVRRCTFASTVNSGRKGKLVWIKCAAENVVLGIGGHHGYGRSVHMAHPLACLKISTQPSFGRRRVRCERDTVWQP
jgi:hypothetical protein